MPRSQSLAVLVLIIAVLAGGALGFSADRFLGQERCVKGGDRASMRERFSTELALTPAQQTAIDSILDLKHRQMDALLDPVRPQLRTVGDSARAQIARVLTEEQREKFARMHDHRDGKRSRR